MHDAIQEPRSDPRSLHGSEEERVQTNSGWVEVREVRGPSVDVTTGAGGCESNGERARQRGREADDLPTLPEQHWGQGEHEMPGGHH